MKPVRPPTDLEKREMVDLALEKGVMAVMGNHLFKFNNKVRRQVGGSPIGMELSGAAARVYMLAWDRKFLALMDTIATDIPDWVMYNSNSAQEEPPLGSRWEDGKVVVREELEEVDSQIPGALRTARIICDAANSIDDMIKMVLDCPL